MAARRTQALSSLLAIVSIAAPPIAPGAASAPPCVFGAGSGAWDLPDGVGGLGQVVGTLDYLPSGKLAFVLVGTLSEVSSPCLSCREGDLDWTLDDGVGVGPDYLAKGRWIGSFLGGQGTWSATIYRPVGPALIPVGRLRGTYDDPPLAGQGTFEARWSLCP